jgi:chitin disaccharide deacetylase
MNDSPIAKPGGFVLCADDYGMTPGVSRGILRLLDAGRITATGAMTNMSTWPAAARNLRAFEGRVDLGVHLNLTCGVPLTRAGGLMRGAVLPKLPSLLARGLAGRLPQADIAAEFEAQLAAFEAAMGRAPDFVDGHQHVHAMPGVRAVLAEVLARRYPGPKPYLRDAADRFAAIRNRGVEVRKAMIVATLARPFAMGMVARGFALNRGFSGYSAFDPAQDYAAAFPAYLRAAGPAHLVMCHPGEVDDALRALDPATESRPQEIAYFLSNRFIDDCAAAGMIPKRFSGL